MKRRTQQGLWCLVVVGLLGCSDPAEQQVEGLYRVPESLDELQGEAFIDHPFPSDLRTRSGSPVYAGMYNPYNVPIVDDYIEVIDGLLEGFSPVASGRLRFAAPIDPASMPANETASIEPDASVQLINVDPDSSGYLTRHPIALSFREPGGQYVLPNTLRWMPAFGYPLASKTRYALVTTRDLIGKNGAPTKPSADLSEVLGLQPATGARKAAAEAVGADVQALEQIGIPRADISQLTIFTTGAPSEELFLFRDDVHENVEAPVFRADGWDGQVIKDEYVEYQGVFGPLPNYQEGNLPFGNAEDGGNLAFGPDGKPKVVDLFDARFSISVPIESACPMPEAGYPVVLYAHGTGGDYRSYIAGGVAKELAKQCLAVMGVDQIFHGTRPGAPADTLQQQLLFYNFENIAAARSNARQSAIDEVQRARLFTEAGAVIPADVSYTEKEIRFDPDRILYFGHSQGSQNGPLFLAVDPSSRGGILSGAGGGIAITLIEKTLPAPGVAGLVRTVLLQLGSDEGQELDVFHPALALAQAIVDPVDPINYIHHLVEPPRDGYAPKSIYMSEGIGPDGIGDSYTPPRGTEALAIRAGLPLQEPVQYLSPLLSWATTTIAVPAQGLSGNIGGGLATGVLAQWPPTGSDGHFVIFDNPGAQTQSTRFLADLAKEPAGRLSAP